MTYPERSMAFRGNRGRRRMLFAGGLLLLPAALWALASPFLFLKIAGVLGLLFLAYALNGQARDLARGGPDLVLSAAGIDDRRTGIGLIPWSEVRAMRVEGSGGHRYLSLSLRDPQPVLQRAGREARFWMRAHRGRAGGDVVVLFHELSPGIDVALAHLRNIPEAPPPRTGDDGASRGAAPA